MKAKVCMFISVAVISGLLCGCGASKTEVDSANGSDNAEITSETVKNNVVDNSMDEDVEEVDEAEEQELEFETLNFNDSVDLGFVQFTVESAGIDDELYPSDTSGVYSYMSDKDGEKYFYLTGTMKNTSGDAYSIEDIVSQLCFDDKYNYSAFLAADNGGGDFYGDYINPLSSARYYIYASIPDELVNSYQKCTVKFGMNENFSGSYYDEFEECDYLYKVEVSK